MHTNVHTNADKIECTELCYTIHVHVLLEWSSIYKFNGLHLSEQTHLAEHFCDSTGTKVFA